MIAVDSSIIIDVIYDDPAFAESSGLALSNAAAMDDIVICDAALAEICAFAEPIEPLLDTLGKSGIRFSAINEQAAIRAGIMQQRFRKRGTASVTGTGKRAAQKNASRSRVIADFLVGAHALMQCNALITRDGNFYRDYFKGLKIINPAG
jgi:predicted nucleic acid-binding protein